MTIVTTGFIHRQVKTNGVQVQRPFRGVRAPSMPSDSFLPLAVAAGHLRGVSGVRRARPRGLEPVRVPPLPVADRPALRRGPCRFVSRERTKQVGSALIIFFELAVSPGQPRGVSSGRPAHVSPIQVRRGGPQRPEGAVSG